ncbi:BglG family transcription antiterminator [Selenomonas sp.]|uniref:BglG family transcription antiterminator n=1 Tax=Selenomonas sp. TaxID=2053611 RepID=UPI002A764519|nr:PTS sugar transporter subunit IIA [Selenomonas sp.]MDY3298453.1 PTS sugar transporter subunit IIA [Selenomonas sp.]
MKLIRRQIAAIQCIYEHPQWGLKDVSAHLGVAAQTVKSDVLQIAPLMEKHHVRIDWLPGGQMRLLGQENMNYMLKAFRTMQEFSLEKQALLLLLLQEDFIVLQDMADTLFVSKSLMEKVMGAALKKYEEELESVRHHGIRVVTTQMERRNHFVEIIMPYVHGVDFAKEIHAFHTNHFPLLNYINKQDVDRAIESVRVIRSAEHFSFTDESITQLFLQMLYIQYVHRAWAFVPPDTFTAGIVEGTAVSRRRARGLHLPRRAAGGSTVFRLSVPDPQETGDVGHRLLPRGHARHDDGNLDVIRERMAVDFRGDDVLLRGLSVHIYTTVVRKNHLRTAFWENDGQGIRQSYPIGLEMAIVAAQVLGRRYDYAVSNEEILYLTLHFQAAIERMQNIGQTLRILVVCHYGMAAASLIAARLERSAGVRVVGSMSMQSFRELAHVDADLVVSTENIEAGDGVPPIIYVTPMLPDRELQQIRQFAETHCMESILMLYIMQAHIIDIEGAEDARAVLRRAADVLEQEGCVTPAYFDSLVEREQLSSTDLDNIAVPHGNPDFVQRTQLLILRLKTPVHWRLSDVQTVFVFAVSRADFQKRFRLISSFYKRLSHPDVREGLRKNSGLDEKEFRLAFLHMVGA